MYEYQEPCVPGRDYLLIQGDHGVRIRYGSLDRRRSKNPRAIKKDRSRTHVTVVRDDGSEVSETLYGAIDSLVPWATWENAARAARYLGLPEVPVVPIFGRAHWRLNRDAARKLGRLVEGTGSNSALADALNWPLESRRPWFGEAYWFLTFDQALLVGEAVHQQGGE